MAYISWNCALWWFACKMKESLSSRSACVAVCRTSKYFQLLCCLAYHGFVCLFLTSWILVGWSSVFLNLDLQHSNPCATGKLESGKKQQQQQPALWWTVTFLEGRCWILPGVGCPRQGWRWAYVWWRWRRLPNSLLLQLSHARWGFGIVGSEEAII